MDIILNGQPFPLPEDATVSGLIQQLELAGRRVALEVNEDIIPRSQYGERRLRPGDRVEIVHAIGGG